jgi:hypothetical protein
LTAADQPAAGDQEDGAQERAVHRAQPADHHHQQQVDRLDDVELVGRHELDLVRVQRAADAGQRGRDRKRSASCSSARWMPMLCAEISESRIATKARPVGERSRFSTASVAAR